MVISYQGGGRRCVSRQNGTQNHGVRTSDCGQLASGVKGKQTEGRSQTTSASPSRQLPIEPLLAIDAGLSEHANEQIHLNHSTMRVGNNGPTATVTMEHKLVPSARERAFEAQVSQPIDELLTADRNQAAPQPGTTSGGLMVRPSSTGMARPLAMLKNSQSSIAAERFFRQVSSELPVAQTPSSPGTSP